MGRATPAIAIPKTKPGTATNRWNESTHLHNRLEWGKFIPGVTSQAPNELHSESFGSVNIKR